MSAEVLPTIILGSRGSELARAQTKLVADALQRAWPALEIKIQIITTRGDERTVEPIDPRAGRKGLFTGEIERALAAREIDLAIHSAKDLPSDATPGLEVWAALPRAAFDDILIQKNPGGFVSLRRNAVIATGSVRRQYQLRWQRPDIRPVELRGNVPTRLRKLMTSDWDGIVLARAGVERLGYELTAGTIDFEGAQFFAEILPADHFLPAGGQGVIAMQLRSDDTEKKKLIAPINDRRTLSCLEAEREFLRLLNGDCNSPVGILASVENNEMTLRAQIFEQANAAPRSGGVRLSLQTEEPKQIAATLFNQMYGREK
ncbi:MAG TPA: hydroxymethylbilane synthase [Chthoniobacterales bacterium]|jgi:hydroxymethylbilane synthase